MTLKEIAKEAGVSISTVSRIINQKDSYNTSIELKEKVWEIVRRTNYKPSEAAKMLRSGEESKGPIKLLACYLARGVSDFGSSPFFANAAQGFEKEALLHNYHVRYSFETSGDPVEMFSKEMYSGLLVIGRHDLSTIRRLRQKFRHSVYVGINPPADFRNDCVICDAHSFSYDAVSYLIKLNHKKIGYIGETSCEVRYSGYIDALQANSIELDPAYIKEAKSINQGYSAAIELLQQENRPTALFCMNDSIAMGVYKAAQELGIKIPKALSVIGADDIEPAQFLTPKLTTIHYETPELGTVAAKVLIDRIEGGHKENLKITLPYYIVERESCRQLL